MTGLGSERAARLRAAFSAGGTWRQGLWVAAIALAARIAILLWSGERFPPADDGTYYQVFAERLSRGLGYTWAWPDGAVTYAAHYPVGYPALLGLLYRIFGSSPIVAGLANAVIGALGVLGVHRIARAAAPAGPAAVAGLTAALHPSLVFYTPALMTEGVTAALLAILGAVALEVEGRERPRFGWLALGLGAGFLVLVRPQALLLVPVLGGLSRLRAGWRSQAGAALLVTALAFAVVLPWTARNCVRMDRCVLVSANGGWNLFIGAAPGATGSFVPLERLGVPAECREVYGEADKDRCFGNAGLRHLLAEPRRYLSLVPAKLLHTFDWSGAPGYYLHTSNSAAFGAEAKLSLGVVEALVERLVVLAGVVGLARADGPRRRARRLCAAVSGLLLLMKGAWIAHLLLVVQAALLGRSLRNRPDAVLAASAVLATALTHAAFFGAGRYGLVCVAVLSALSASAWQAGTKAKPAGDGKGSAGF